MKRYSVDCRDITSLVDFIEAMNAGMIRQVGGEWHWSFDAFNDYLTWPQEAEYELELLGAEVCRAQLGHQAMAAWLREGMGRIHPENVPLWRERLARAEAGEGETLFDFILEIIARHQHVRLLLK